MDTNHTQPQPYDRRLVGYLRQGNLVYMGGSYRTVARVIVGRNFTVVHCDDGYSTGFNNDATVGTYTRTVTDF